MLASTELEKRETFTIRKTICGDRHPVLHLKAATVRGDDEQPASGEEGER